MRRLLLCLSWLIFGAGSAQAQWIHQAEDNPFEKTKQHLAISARSGSLLGFRCTSEDDVALIMATTEKVERENRASLALMPVKMLVIIDDADKVELDAEFDVTPEGDRLRVTSTGDNVLPILKSAMMAKKRFAVAFEMMGKVFGSTIFGVDGSRRAIEKLVVGCKLKLPSS